MPGLLGLAAGDYRGPVTDAAGTPYFEPDGVFLRPSFVASHPVEAGINILDRRGERGTETSALSRLGKPRRYR